MWVAFVEEVACQRGSGGQKPVLCRYGAGEADTGENMEGIITAHHSMARPVMLCEFELIKSLTAVLGGRYFYYLCFTEGQKG